MDIYINSAEAISSQNTFDTDEFLQIIENPEQEYYTVINPIYKDYINPRKLRRMSKIVRMGVACSVQSLKTAKIKQPNAIIIGTGLGCVTDTIKFLNNMNENHEEMLNPTAFIQSTHNTVSGQIALSLGCKNYNFTFSQQTASFETSLQDAIIKLQDPNINTVLLGGLDEITAKTYELLNKRGCVKTTTKNLFTSNTNGYFAGEGSNFFTLCNEKNSLNIAKISGISNFNIIINKLPQNLKELFTKNNISIDNIDLIISGKNGDISETPEYNNFENLINNQPIINYKNIVGQYDTASGFAMWLASKIIEKQEIPSTLNLTKIINNQFRNILIHHYNKDHNHSFILISKC